MNDFFETITDRLIVIIMGGDHSWLCVRFAFLISQFPLWRVLHIFTYDYGNLTIFICFTEMKI